MMKIDLKFSLFLRTVLMQRPCCSKEDYVEIAKLRRRPFTPSMVWKRTTESLREDFEPSVAEFAFITQLQQRRDSFDVSLGRPSIGTLKTLITSAGGSCPSQITRGGMLDVLSALGWAPVDFQLDPDQVAAVERRRQSRLVIYAGPGAGKTTTLCHIVRSICADESRARVLVLAYNRSAEQTLIERLKVLRVARIKNTKLYDGGVAGVAVLTFDKLGFRINDNFRDDITAPLDTNQDTYTRSLYVAINNLRRCNVALWDVVVVDEGQDILPIHAEIIRELCSATNAPRLIAAGDPRQELYPGAKWFSELWTRSPDLERVVLRYNHRSAPEIVDALNAFSRANFPNIHVDQIAVRAPGGRVRHHIVQTNKAWEMRVDERLHSARKVGELVGDIMSKNAPNHCYAVGPITIERFGMDAITLTTRQVVNELNPGVLVSPNSHKPDAGVYAIATSRRIKGTERACVVVFGVDIDYGACVDRSSAIKMAFVAISRARDELVIVSRNWGRGELVDAMAPLYQAIGATMAPLYQAIGATLDTCTRTQTRVKEDLHTITVAGSFTGLSSGGRLCGCEAIEVAPSQNALGAVGVISPENMSAPVLVLGDERCDADFMGVYAEALIAQALGVQLATRLDVVVEKKSENCGLRRNQDGSFTMHVKEDKADLMREVAASAMSTDSINAPYIHAVLKYSAIICRAWTVSARFAQRCAMTSESATAIANQIRDIVQVAGSQSSLVKYSTRGAHHLRCRRPVLHDTTGCISFEIDLKMGDVPVELKYVDVLSVEHRRQAAVYAALCGAPRALLFNAKKGNAEWVPAASIGQVENAARVLINIRLARKRALGPLRPFAVALPDNMQSGRALFIDTENDPSGMLLEIAAVVVDMNEWSVTNVFDELASDVKEISRGAYLPRPGRMPDISAMTGLSWSASESVRRCASVDLQNKFTTWSAQILGTPTIVHWGGNERMLASGNPTVDALHAIFRPWLALKGTPRRDLTNLKAAVEQVIPKLLYAPHCAFEDTIATMGVVISMLSTESML
jgi:hypothetical protein